MSFNRTFGFAIHSSLIGTLILAPSFMPIPPYVLVILALVSGFSLIAFFAPAHLEERYEIVCFVFILASVLQIILGALTNLHALTPRNIPIELAILFLGLFSPLFAMGKFSGEKLPLAPLAWNIATVGLFYSLVLGVVHLTGTIA